jgi:hypothetical protein
MQNAKEVTVPILFYKFNGEIVETKECEAPARWCVVDSTGSQYFCAEIKWTARHLILRGITAIWNDWPCTDIRSFSLWRNDVRRITYAKAIED